MVIQPGVTVGADLRNAGARREVSLEGHLLATPTDGRSPEATDGTASAPRQAARSRLGELLVSAKIITQVQLDRALREQTSWGGRLGQNLLTLGFVDETKLSAAIAMHLGLPSVDLDRARLPPNVSRLLPLELCERYGMLPLGEKVHDGKILVALFDPTNHEALLAVRRASGLQPVVHVATATSIDRAIRKIYYGEASPASAPGSPLFTVTRNTMEAVQQVQHDRDLATRIDELEEKVDRLTSLVRELSNRLPG
jgi:type IV pilus assembly protein PilB